MIINNQSHILYNYLKQNIDENPINICVTTITFNALYQLLDIVDKETIQIKSEFFKTGARISPITTSTVIKIKTIIEIHDKSDKDMYLFGYLGEWIKPKAVNESMLNKHFNKAKKSLQIHEDYTLYGLKHYTNALKYNKMKKMGVNYNDRIAILKTLNGHSNEGMTLTYLRDVLQIYDENTTNILEQLYD